MTSSRQEKVNSREIGQYLQHRLIYDAVILYPKAHITTNASQGIKEKQYRGPMDTFVGLGALEKPQSTLNAYWKKKERTRVYLLEEISLKMALHLMFLVAHHLKKMIEHIGQYDRGLKPQSMCEFREWIL